MILLSGASFLIINRTARPLDEITNRLTREHTGWNLFPLLRESLEDILRDNSQRKKKMEILEPVYMRRMRIGTPPCLDKSERIDITGL